jgi:hypothetical protein
MWSCGKRFCLYSVERGARSALRRSVVVLFGWHKAAAIQVDSAPLLPASRLRSIEVIWVAASLCQSRRRSCLGSCSCPSVPQRFSQRFSLLFAKSWLCWIVGETNILLTLFDVCVCDFYKQVVMSCSMIVLFRTIWVKSQTPNRGEGVHAICGCVVNCLVLTEGSTPQ